MRMASELSFLYPSSFQDLVHGPPGAPEIFSGTPWGQNYFHINTKMLLLGVFFLFFLNHVDFFFIPVVWLILVDIWQKTTKFCKATNLQLKKINKVAKQKAMWKNCWHLSMNLDSSTKLLEVIIFFTAINLQFKGKKPFSLEYPQWSNKKN